MKVILFHRNTLKKVKANKAIITQRRIATETTYSTVPEWVFFMWSIYSGTEIHERHGCNNEK